MVQTLQLSWKCFENKCIFTLNMIKRLGLFLLIVLMSNSVSAETIYVKYRGFVDLNLFVCSDTASSVVHRICYRKEKEYLVVKLGQVYHHYCRFPLALYQSWLAADSKGKFYQGYVRNNFDCQKTDIPKD